MNILVTGGAGFIGNNFIRLILQKYPEYKVTNFDTLTYAGNLDNCKDYAQNKNYKFVKGDIKNFEEIKKVMKDVDTIVHFAAESHVDRSIEGGSIFVQTNVLGTYNLLEATRQQDAKFLHISTDEVYGSTKTGRFKEEDILKPNSPYSASKAGADLLVRSFNKTHALKTMTTRSSNNYGPFQYPEKLIPLFITNLMKGKKVPLYGTGLNQRDWIYVTDNCEAINTVMHSKFTGDIVNIGTGEETTNLEITKTLLKLLGKGKEMIQYVEDRKGHDWRYALDTTKIKKMGWKPEMNLEKGLRKTVEWYKGNEWWWEPLLKN